MRGLPLYHFYELNHAAVSPFRAAADATRLYFQNPLNPFSETPFGRNMAAAAELFERSTRRYGKPAFDLTETMVDGERVPVLERIVWEKPFCDLLHFQKADDGRARQEKVLIVAPMSGHYATLLRGTVEAMLPEHDVYITDWADARMVPLVKGRFDLDDYIDYLVEMMHLLGPDLHVMGVCQPSVPVLAAVSLMAARGDACLPASMILMGGPIDTRVNPTAVSTLAQSRDLNWFRRNVIMTVPFPHPGFMRSVYPGFLQIYSFLGMNPNRHAKAHQDFYRHLIEGDGDSAEKHRTFYDEYLAVMDLTAEFYLQTVDAAFIHHTLPKGEMRHRGELVDPAAIRSVALLTIEGENDDISGIGQTEAAHRLCANIPTDRRGHYLQPKVGHYGVFNGSRFRSEIQPRIADFIATHGTKQSADTAARPNGGRVPSVPRQATKSTRDKGQKPGNLRKKRPSSPSRSA